MKGVLSMWWWILLASLLALAVAPAMTAISAFTTLPELGISVEGYEAFFGADNQAQGRLAAGFVTDPVFWYTDLGQALIMVGLLFTLLIMRGRPALSRSGANVVVSILLGLLIVLQGVLMVALLPRMNTHLEGYREAARANLHAAATTHLGAFNTLHPIAEKLYGVRAIMVMGMVAASGFAVAAGRETET